MGGSKSSSSGDVRKEKRYAPYIEVLHEDFLDTVVEHRVIDESPFGYTSQEASAAFLGIGYAISNFPSLYDMFGKFMAGLDIESLWNSVFENNFDRPEVTADLVASIEIIDDKTIRKKLSDFQLRLRGINAVSTSSFVIGRAVIEDKRIKDISKVSIKSKKSLLPEIGKEYATQLNWNKKTLTDYALVMKEYFLWKTDQDSANYSFASRNALWPLTSLAFEGAALGVMQSAAVFNKTMEPRERSTVSKVLLVASYTATGAYYGSAFGPWGTVIGGVIGFIIGIAIIYLE